MTRGEVYERAHLDHIHHVDAALARLVELGQAVLCDSGEGRRWAPAPRGKS
ncbi:MAG TPA: hypothetical protein PLN96_05270 [Zoogloea sp.]|uniref:hypothetical protein n=1 Tax=Zoogloea sp. TaxID=49181 RepID=UPI002CA71DF4|nr:hypothetical protein [Zoogloea sp.]HNA67251.1 hypothetical protein [Rhodocyclaceae bacterium]HNI47247.1 hypothetical protein [Zoogloea sp.]